VFSYSPLIFSTSTMCSSLCFSICILISLILLEYLISMMASDCSLSAWAF
jgi:hypothetical protein